MISKLMNKRDDTMQKTTVMLLTCLFLMFTIGLPHTSFANTLLGENENINNLDTGSSDYFSDALRLHPKAQQGDKVSQFYLYKIFGILL